MRGYFLDRLRRYFGQGGAWDAAIALSALFVIAVIWSITLERVAYERRETEENVVKQNSNLVLALEQHTVHALTSAEQALIDVGREYGAQGRKFDIATMFRDRVVGRELFRDIGVVDERGHVVLDAVESGNATYLGDRELFRTHETADSGKMFIGRPLLGRITGQWVMPVSRRINNPDGSFGGVVFAGIDPNYFIRFYQQADLGRDGVVNLVGLDGITRARRVGDKGTFGREMRKSTLLAMQAQVPAGSFVSRGVQEGIPRYQSYRTLPDYPLIVSVGTSQAEALAGFYDRRRAYHLWSALGSILIALFAVLQIAALARQRRAQEEAAIKNTVLATQQEASLDAILIVDEDEKIVSYNRKFIDLWRIPEELVRTGDDQPVLRAVIGQVVDPEAFLARVNYLYQHREERSNEEVRTRDGRAIDRYSAPVVGADGRYHGRIWYFRDVTERKQSEASRSATLERVRDQLQAVGEASRSSALVTGDVEKLAGEITEMAARVAGVERANIWLFNEDETELRCVDSYEATPRRHSAGMVLSERNFGNEFAALKAVGYVDADDPLTDPRTAGYVEGYLKPLGITSMLDVVVQVSGERLGLLCLEHVARAHHWESDEIVFASQLADKIALALVHRRRQEAQDRQRESERRLGTLMANLAGMVYRCRNDTAWTMEFVSEGCRDLTGYTPAEFTGDGAVSYGDLILPDQRASVRRTVQEALEQRKPFQISYQIRTAQGELRWVWEQGRGVFMEDGGLLAIEGFVSDVTERVRAEGESRLAAKAFENIADGIVVTDSEKRIVSVNPAFTTITGYLPEEILGKTPRHLQSGRHDAAFFSEMWREIGQSGHWRGEIWDRRKNGEVYPQLLSISAVKDASGAVTHYVGVSTDITSLKRYEEQLLYQASHDALTGLANRSLLQDRFRETLSRARRHDHQAAVLFLDLDRFKSINDSLGHDVGDLLLQSIAKRLMAGIREVDTAARFGGDEFAVLLDIVDGDQSVATVAQKLLDAMTAPFQLAGNEVYMSVSIGISCFPQDGADAETLLKNADTAMYLAKTEGRNKYQFFSADMNARALENLQMSNGLRLALQRGELLLHYQPQYDLKSGRVTGAEALVRWHHPEFGLIPPYRFIPLAEETGLIEPIGEWVLMTACKQMRTWRDAGLPLERVAVNLSARQFRNPVLVQRIAAVLEETRLPAHQLELEVTESMVMRNPENAAGVLAQLKAMGISIAIDDFGTGYSSLSYLKRFPIDYLKIDQSFVNGVPDDADDAAIIQAIIAMAKSLNLRLIAEGVETEGQRAFLEKHGCDEGQGYLFSRPVPADDCAALMRRNAIAPLRKPRGVASRVPRRQGRVQDKA